MKKRGRMLLFPLVLLLSGITYAQEKNYSVANAHSHNDYLNVTPFYNAYNLGYGSIEADIFSLKGELYVAHSKSGIKEERTLQNLYLNPLSKVLATDPSRKLILLIDVKENYKEALSLLVTQLQSLKTYLTTLRQHRPLQIVISGMRPPPVEYKNYPAYIFFDDDLKLQHTKKQWKRVGLVSLPFTNYSNWRGNGEMPEKDKSILKQIIDRVHARGKAFRFWAAPDTKTSWQQQMNLGVDFIGADKIEELAALLQKQ